MTSKRPAFAHVPAEDAAPAALRALATALMPYLRELLVEAASGEQLVVDVAKVVPLPKRAIHRACRLGELSAVKRGRRWLATRSAVDAWLRLGTPSLVTTSPEEDDSEEVRRSLMRSGPRRRARRPAT